MPLGIGVARLSTRPANIPRRKSHCLRAARRSLQDGFDSRQKRNRGDAAGGCAFGGDDHDGVALLQIGKRSFWKTIEDLLQIRGAAGAGVAAFAGGALVSILLLALLARGVGRSATFAGGCA